MLTSVRGALARRSTAGIVDRTRGERPLNLECTVQTRILTRVVIGGAAAMIAIAVACSEQKQVPSADPTGPGFAKGGPRVKSVTVAPPTASVAVGAAVQYTATASPASASATFAWASSNSSVASVSSTGLVTGIAAGTSTISAVGGGVTGSAVVTVTSAPSGNSVVLVGAGDIASCSSTGDEATAALLDNIAGTVFLLGDNVYDNGTATEYRDCYDPSWGRHRARTRPTPGNHEYNTLNATGYYGYFGSAAGDPAKGYYSYEAGDWHVVVLNSNCGTVSCAAGSAQEQWLRADLAASTKSCTLAYWHHPRFNSGIEHGNNTNVTPLWNALYENNADVVLNGHEHTYERFAPQTPNGVADAVRGIRQFVVGTGGRSHYGFGTIQPNSQVRNGSTYGVLKLTLDGAGYDWQFVPVQGATFTDSGRGTCH